MLAPRLALFDVRLHPKWRPFAARQRDRRFVPEAAFCAQTRSSLLQRRRGCESRTRRADDTIVAVREDVTARDG